MKHLSVLFFLLVLSCSAFAVDVQTIDKAADPCTDFYQYANGVWLKNNPIPPDRSSWGAGAELNERNLAILHQILDEAAANTTASGASVQGKVGRFYRIGMETAKIEAQGIKPLEPEFARIRAIKDPAGLQQEIARLHGMGLTPAFAFTAYQDFKDSTRIVGWLFQAGLGLPERDYYFKDDDETKKIREEYVKHIAKMFELAGDPAATASMEAQNVMKMETRLAKASMTAVELRNVPGLYHMMKVSEIQAQAPQLDWASYFREVGLANPGDIDVAQPDFIKEVGRLLADTPLSDWQTYLRWNVINGAAPYLSDAFVAEDFAFNGKVLKGTPELRPRWKRVLETTDTVLGEDLGQLYVAKAFPPEAKARALDLVKNLQLALGERLSKLQWISETTRKEALRKLNAIQVKIGYPDKWRDYSAYPVDQDSYVMNVLQGTAFEFNRQVRKIGKPIDRTEWQMTPPTINAYYNPNFNEIVFPAGILQPPYFDMKADDASNYGSIGTIIGHELTHGFDDQGRLFDADGNMKDWWTPQDEKKYNELATLVVKQYDGYVAIETMHINGKLTLGENIADFGGLRIAYLALQKAMAAKPKAGKIDGFTPEQRFFLAFAQHWRLNIRPEQLRLQVSTDPHSPSAYRVLGPLSRLLEFQQAFGCKATEQQPTIW